MIYASKFKSLPYSIRFELYLIYKELCGSKTTREILERQDLTKAMNLDARDLEKEFLKNKINFDKLVSGFRKRGLK